MPWQEPAQEAPGRLKCSVESFFCDEKQLPVTTNDKRIAL